VPNPARNKGVEWVPTGTSGQPEIPRIGKFPNRASVRGLPWTSRGAASLLGSASAAESDEPTTARAKSANFPGRRVHILVNAW